MLLFTLLNTAFLKFSFLCINIISMAFFWFELFCDVSYHPFILNFTVLFCFQCIYSARYIARLSIFKILSDSFLNKHVSPVYILL